MGSKVLDYTNSKISYTYSPEIKEEHKKNRMFLKSLMENENFAPYLGEWWHFSYGDREWAKYYNKQYAIYQQVSYEDVIVKEFKYYSRSVSQPSWRAATCTLQFSVTALGKKVLRCHRVALTLHAPLAWQQVNK